MGWGRYLDLLRYCLMHKKGYATESFERESLKSSKFCFTQRINEPYELKVSPHLERCEPVVSGGSYLGPMVKYF